MLRSRAALLVSLLAAVVTTLAPLPAHAVTNGMLDPGFGTAGVFNVDLSAPSIDVANAALPVNGGGPVLVGSTNDNFALATPNGDGFGNPKGQATIAFGQPSAAYGVAQISTDELVVVGRAGDDFAVVRTKAGAPVVAFGDLGRVRTSFGRPAVARDAARQYDDALVAGTVGSGADADVAIANYDVKGRLNPAFGSGGIVVADISGGEDAANAVDMDSLPGYPGRSVIAGRAEGAALVARYQADGSPDPAFGVGGRALLEITPGDDVAYALSVQPNAGMHVAGIAGGSGFVARLTAAGVLDDSFGTGGVVMVDLGPGGVLKSVGQGYGGVIVAGGTFVSSAGTDAVLVRLAADGAFDAGFGTAGRTVLDLGGSADSGNALLGSGYGGDVPMIVGGDGADMRIAQVDLTGREVTPAGRARPRIDFSSSSDTASAMAVQPDGAILVAGGGDQGMVLMRFRPDGRLDTGFGRGGVVKDPLGSAVAMALLPDGKILVGGSRGGQGQGVYRLHADGRVDQTFGTLGFAITNGVRALAVHPDGRIVVGDAAVSVLSPSGQPQSSVTIGENQVVTSLAVYPDGGVLAAVRHLFREEGATVRIRPDGTREPFFTGGLAFAPATLVRLPDGRFAAAGAIVNDGSSSPPLVKSDIGVMVKNADGTTDATFGGLAIADGVVRLDIAQFDFAQDITLTPDGKILVLVSYSKNGPNSRLGLVRLLGDGRLDRTFGSRGVWVSSVDILPSAIALGSGGRILAAGTTNAQNYDVTLVGVSPDLVTKGRVRGWGFGGFGQLGVGSAPTIAVAAGTLHTLAVAENGTVRASGWNVTGQLGDGTTTDRNVPVQVPGLTGVVAVAAGTYHSLALKADGTVWAWGWNYFGQLGNGSVLDSRVPVRVPGLTQVTAIAAGVHHNLALRADGTAWAWGWNGLGQLGNRSTIDSPIPVPVSAGVTELAAGSYHSLFLYDNGTIVAAGWNAFGQLGNDTGPPLTPLVVEGSGTYRGRYVAIAGGGLHSLAVLADGTVWAWGGNHFGQLGNGSTTARPIPVRVPGVTNGSSVAGGAFHSVARGRDGVVRTWGLNGSGQLGTDTTANSAVPVTVTAVPAGEIVTGIAAGAFHTVAF